MRAWIKLGILTLLVLSLAFAEANYRYGGLSLTVPAGWTTDGNGGQDPTLLAVVRSPSEALVIIRRHPARTETLEDAFKQLKYNVIVKLEGRVLSKAYVQMNGVKAIRVVYWGRASTGSMKTFVRYFCLTGGDLINVHCVCSARYGPESAEFQALADHLTYAPEDGEVEQGNPATPSPAPKESSPPES